MRTGWHRHDLPVPGLADPYQDGHFGGVDPHFPSKWWQPAEPVLLGLSLYDLGQHRLLHCHAHTGQFVVRTLRVSLEPHPQGRLLPHQHSIYQPVGRMFRFLDGHHYFVHPTARHLEAEHVAQPQAWSISRICAGNGRLRRLHRSPILYRWARRQQRPDLPPFLGATDSCRRGRLRYSGPVCSKRAQSPLWIQDTGPALVNSLVGQSGFICPPTPFARISQEE